MRVVLVRVHVQVVLVRRRVLGVELGQAWGFSGEGGDVAAAEEACGGGRGGGAGSVPGCGWWRPGGVLLAEGAEAGVELIVD